MSIIKAKDVHRKRRSSKYQEVLEALKSLKEGYCYTFTVPSRQGCKQAKMRKWMNRIGAAISKSGIKAPAGCRFSKSVTEGDRVIAICCVRVVGPLSNKKKGK